MAILKPGKQAKYITEEKSISLESHEAFLIIIWNIPFINISIKRKGVMILLWKDMMIKNFTQINR